MRIITISPGRKNLHDGNEYVIHRKGATPAAEGVLGIIPGSMTAPGYVVSGLGNESSLNSAAHGAGRKMSRQKAKNSITVSSSEKGFAKREGHVDWWKS